MMGIVPPKIDEQPRFLFLSLRDALLLGILVIIELFISLLLPLPNMVCLVIGLVVLFVGLFFIIYRTKEGKTLDYIISSIIKFNNRNNYFMRGASVAHPYSGTLLVKVKQDNKKNRPEKQDKRLESAPSFMTQEKKVIANYRSIKTKLNWDDEWRAELLKYIAYLKEDVDFDYYLFRGVITRKQFAMYTNLLIEMGIVKRYNISPTNNNKRVRKQEIYSYVCNDLSRAFNTIKSHNLFPTHPPY